MPAPANPFPLNIDSKIDSWGKLQILQHIHPSLKLTADEINKMIQALEYLNNNTVTGGYSGNVPLKLKFVSVDHSTPGSLSSKVKTVVNAGANYVLADGYTQWFYTHRVVLTNGPGILSTPGGPSYAVITEYFYLNKKIPLINGVASLGVGGTEINTGDLVPLPARDTRSFAPTTFDLGNIGASTIHAAVSAGTDRSTPNTATIVFTAVQNGESKAWLYLGQQENVGASFPALTPADFRIFPADGNGTDPAPPPAQRIYKEYDDIDELLIRQREQTGNELILVIDAVADTNIYFAPGQTKRWALYRYLKTTNGTLADYRFLGAPYATTKPKQTIKSANFTLDPVDQDSTIISEGKICTIDPITKTYPAAFTVAMKNDAGDTNLVIVPKTGWSYQLNDADAISLTTGGSNVTLSWVKGGTCTVILKGSTNKIMIDGGVE
tara:strand:+ start:987 stop:2300 length:1314 start_codon:yes stop_codon:yes gene_type:complete